MSKSLAIKYRPTIFEDLTEQSAVVKILNYQIETSTIKHGYLFCGGAGTGKTTSARIFANMINKGAGTPIELDAASNNSVEDIRRLCDDAQTQSIDSEYKVFVIDECHSLSNQAWQAMLKTLEEPPSKSIFILCTTNPEKIPRTILSRVQRYNFQRISQAGIVNRLIQILDWEELSTPHLDAVEYIAKLADGGMRDAITLLDKCLSYSEELSMETVVKALGVADYETMNSLTEHLMEKNVSGIIDSISCVHNSGVDLKLFMKNYFEYILDLNILGSTGSLEYTHIPDMYKDDFKNVDFDYMKRLLAYITDLNSEIKWAQNPKSLIIARLVLFTEEV